MAFDLEIERQNLDRYTTYWEMRYSGCEKHLCDGCFMPCGCMIIQSMNEKEARFRDVYLRYMTRHVKGNSRLSRARSAFWANLQFCKNFNEYFWMHPECFGLDAQYYTWRDYLISELFIDYNEEKEYTLAFKSRTEKYKTWNDIPDISTEELGI